MSKCPHCKKALSYSQVRRIFLDSVDRLKLIELYKEKISKDLPKREVPDFREMESALLKAGEELPLLKHSIKLKKKGEEK